MKISGVLVTGGNGFIGSNLCRHLRARSLPVRALVLPGEDTALLESLGVEVVRGDITADLPTTAIRQATKARQRTVSSIIMR